MGCLRRRTGARGSHIVHGKVSLVCASDDLSKTTHSEKSVKAEYIFSKFVD